MQDRKKRSRVVIQMRKRTRMKVGMRILMIPTAAMTQMRMILTIQIRTMILVRDASLERTRRIHPPRTKNLTGL